MTSMSMLTPAGFLSLEISADEATEVRCGEISLKTLCDPARCGHIEVPVPGWIWRNTPPGKSAELHWPGGGVTIPREAIRERLAQLAEQPAENWEAAILVGALEHVHYGALAPSAAGEELTEWLRQAAALTGLRQLVPDPVRPVAPPPGQAAIAAFGAALRQPQGAVELSAQLGSAFTQALTLATTSDDRRALVLSASVEFCRADSLSQLEPLLRAQGFELPAAAEPWNRAQALAFHLLSGDEPSAHLIAREIAETPCNWVSTPVLAWVLRYAAPSAGHRLATSLRTTLIHALLRAAEARAPLSCAEMIRSTLSLLARDLGLLDSELSNFVVWRSLRAFGTSPTFWDGIAAQAKTGRDLPAELVAGLQAFRLLQAGASSGRKNYASAVLAETGLRRLRNLGVADIERLQVEFLGPQIAGGAAVSRTLTEAPNGTATLLRADLAPKPGQPLPDAFLRRALREASWDVPADPRADLQRHAMALARSISAPWAPDALSALPPKPGDAVTQLLALLEQLASPEARYAGIGIGAALLADLAPNPAPEARAALLALVPGITALLRELSGSERLLMARAPFPRSALARLRACAATRPELAPVTDILPPSPPGDSPLRRPATVPLGPALIDTLVLVVSCHANLDTRADALRRGWLADLNQMQIPYLIVVGGTETQLEGDILQVAAPDTYEGLPQKIVAMLDWVMTYTGFAHVLKIDDDCHVDPVAWFGDALWRLADWYGRRLDKSGGLAERGWHQGRATDEAARLSFETLPLEGVYTDGSTGYALSRAAMSSIMAATQQIEGRRLIAGAFSEDRMIGTLLTKAGFVPESANYYSLILRKSHRNGIAVPQWAEGVMANDRLRHCKVVHFDGVVPGAAVEAARSAHHPSPARLWPSNRQPGTGYDNGALCLISPPERLAQATGAEVVVIAVVRNERIILPHFLDHYRRLGVGGFLIADNLSDDGSLDYLAAQTDVGLFSASGQFRTTNQGTDWKLALMSQLRGGCWSLVADADEFLILPPGSTLGEHVAGLPKDVDAQRVLMRDMYPKGNFALADFSRHSPFEAAPLFDNEPFLRNSIWRGPFSNSETLTSALRHRLMPSARTDSFVAQKTALIRYLPWMRFSTSLHYATEVNHAAEDLIFAHFKYHAGFAAKAKTEVARGQYWNEAEEYRAYRDTGFASIAETG